jgi:excisionase family DNA binding protein
MRRRDEEYPRKGKGSMDDLLTVGDAARVLDVTPRYVQDLADRDRLPVMRTARGLRLFRRADVEKLAAERAKRPKRRGSLVSPVGETVTA